MAPDEDAPPALRLRKLFLNMTIDHSLCVGRQFPAHDGLWESASATAGDLLARLAVEHCVHEARGLDVVPQTIARFRSGGDPETADLLEKVIYPEEITHCAVGVKWLTYLCKRELQAGNSGVPEAESSRDDKLTVREETTSTGKTAAEVPTGTAAARASRDREECAGSREGLTKSEREEEPRGSAGGASVAQAMEACTLTERPGRTDTCQVEKARCLEADTSGGLQVPVGSRSASGESQAEEASSVRVENGVSESGSDWRTESSDDNLESADRSSDEAENGAPAEVLSDAELKCFVVSRFHEVVRRHFRGPLKPPFNHWARARAGFDEEWYMPLANPAT